MKAKRDLPRLGPEWYRGRAWVFWTHTVDQRSIGWLDERFHLEFREALCHAQVRQWLACPIYVLMPDHIHLIWIGARDGSDQLLASRFLRRVLNRLLERNGSERKLQKQAHDHVLREEERLRSAFEATWSYTLRPIRRERTSLRIGGNIHFSEAWFPAMPASIPGARGFSKDSGTCLNYFALRSESSPKIRRARGGIDEGVASSLQENLVANLP